MACLSLCSTIRFLLSALVLPGCLALSTFKDSEGTLGNPYQIRMVTFFVLVQARQPQLESEQMGKLDPD